MGALLKNFSLKLKLFYPILVGMLLVIFLFAYLNIYKQKKLLYQSVERNLSLEVQTIRKMFERERALKLEKVKQDINIALKAFLESKIDVSKQTYALTIENQVSGVTHQAILSKLIFSNTVNEDSLVSRIAGLTNSSVTIFQKTDRGYVRIATNVMRDNGKSAKGTYLSNEAEVVKTISEGKPFIGRAFVVNNWCLTAYVPFYISDSIVGMLYVGTPEKDLDTLKKILSDLRIGKTGYAFVFDSEKDLIIEPEQKLLNWNKEEILDQIIGNEQGVRYFKWNGSEVEQILAFTYYAEFDLYIAATVKSDEETSTAIDNIIQNSILAAIVISILFSIFVLFITTKRLHSLMGALQTTSNRLKKIKVDLKQSEQNFLTFFYNSGDDNFVFDIEGNIIEVNKMMCENLAYTREEIIGKALGIFIADAAVAKLRTLFNLENVESQVFEAELLTKSGIFIQVEIQAKKVEFNGQQVILCNSRNIQDRLELERKLLSVVIQTEERERERFSKDIHDGLGPLLSTIKLYINELEGDDVTKEEKADYIKYLNELIDEAVSTSRSISNNLMPRIIHEYGLVKALQSFCEKVNYTNSLKIDFITNNIESEIDIIIQLNLFRITSELINNTIKHAKANQITIDIKREDSKIHLNFNDDGIGFNVEQIMSNRQKGIGLKSIISRVKAINGVYKFTSAPNQGFHIEVII